MMKWSIRVEFDRAIDPDAMERLTLEFEAITGSHADNDRTDIMFNVDGATMFDAVNAASERAKDALGVLSQVIEGRAPRMVGMSVETYSDMAVRSFGVERVPLVGIKEIREMAGGKVSREAVRQWTERLEFPVQIATVSGNPAYYRPEVEDYLESIGRLEVERIDPLWFMGKAPRRTTNSPSK